MMLGTGIRPPRQGRLLLIGEQPSTERMMGPRREGERERERYVHPDISPRKEEGCGEMEEGRWRRGEEQGVGTMMEGCEVETIANIHRRPHRLESQSPREQSNYLH